MGFRSDQRPRMARRQIAGLDQILHILGQRQQPQQVGDVAPAFSQRFPKLFLGVAEPVHQLPITRGLFHRVEIRALDILDDRDLQHLGVVQIADQDRNSCSAPFAPRASGARPRRSRTRHQRRDARSAAEGSPFPDRCRQIRQILGIEGAPWLIRVRLDLFDRNLGIGAPHRLFGRRGRFGRNIRHQRRQSTPQPRVCSFLCHGLPSAPLRRRFFHVFQSVPAPAPDRRSPPASRNHS